MRKQLLTTLGMLIATLSMMATNGGNKLTVVVKNVESTEGIINVMLFDAEANWLKKGKGEKVRIDNKEMVIIEFENVKDGTYAVCVIHDENLNGDLDANFLGMPTEPYGFSNDARGMFGPADFNESKFEISGDKTIKVTVK